MELQVSIIDGKLTPQRYSWAMALRDTNRRIWYFRTDAGFNRSGRRLGTGVDGGITKMGRGKKVLRQDHIAGARSLQDKIRPSDPA